MTRDGEKEIESLAEFDAGSEDKKESVNKKLIAIVNDTCI